LDSWLNSWLVFRLDWQWVGTLVFYLVLVCWFVLKSIRNDAEIEQETHDIEINTKGKSKSLTLATLAFHSSQSKVQ